MNETMSWYQALDKPFFAPPAWVFGPVWLVLYVLIVASFGYVAYQVWRGRWPLSMLVPLCINLCANLAFTPLQFGLKSNLLAAADILIVFGTIIWIIRITRHRNVLIAYSQIPYLLWVSFATVLQLSITYMNW